MRKFLVLLSLALLTACGFQLRGSYSLPFETIYINMPESSLLYASLKRSIEAGSKTKVIDDKNSATATLTVIGDQQIKNILSLSSTGRVREYQLVRAFTFRVHNTKGQDFVPQSTITLRRDLGFNDQQVLAKESEEQLLQRDMETDLVQQLMRRLSLAKPPTTRAETLNNATTP